MRVKSVLLQTRYMKTCSYLKIHTVFYKKSWHFYEIFLPQIRIKIFLLNPGCRTVKLPLRANTMPFHFFQRYPPFSALFLCSSHNDPPWGRVQKRIRTWRKVESVCKRAWYSGLLVIQQRACQQKLVCFSRGKSEACEEAQMCARRVSKQGFDMTAVSVLIQPEHHQGNISVVGDNKLHKTLGSVLRVRH